VRSALGEVAEAFAAAFAVEKINEFARSMGEMGEQIEKTAMQLGVSTSEVQQLDYIAKSSGTSVETLSSEFSRLAMAMGEQSDRASRGLRTLGLTFRDLAGKDTMDQLTVLAERFSHIEDGTAKTQAGLAIMGRSFRDMIPFLNQGAEGIKRLKDEADALGAIVPPEGVVALAALHHEFVMMDAAVRGALVEGFLPFRGAVQGVVAIVADLASEFSAAMKSGGMMKDIVDLIATAAKGVVTAIAAAVYVLKDLWATGVFAVDTVGAGFMTLGRAIAAVVSAVATGWREFFAGLLEAGTATVRALGAEFAALASMGSAAAHLDLAGVKAAWAEMGTAASAAGKEIGTGLSRAGAGVDMSGAKKAFDDFNTDQIARNKGFTETLIKNDQAFAGQYKKIWDDIHAHEHGDRAPGTFAPPDRNAADRVRAAMEAIQGEIKAEQDGLKMKISVWDAAVAANRMTQQERMRLVQDATSDEYGAEHDLLEKELAIEGLKLAQRQKILNDIGALERKHYAEMVKLDQESVASAQKDIEGYLSTVTGAFNSQLRGLLAGTTSWRNAMKAIAGDLIMAMIQGVEKWVVTFLAGQLATKVAAVAGAGERAAAETAGSGASILDLITKALKSIGSGVASTIAGVSGESAPILGPAAPAAGIAAGAVVEGAAMAAMPTAEIGAWKIGSVSPFVLHPNEMVLPGPSADVMRDALAGGGGGGAVHLHVSAVDAGSVRRLFENSGMQIAEVLREVWQKNRSVRPAF
jgi:hypothetical protein